MIPALLKRLFRWNGPKPHPVVVDPSMVDDPDPMVRQVVASAWNGDTVVGIRDEDGTVHLHKVKTEHQKEERP